MKHQTNTAFFTVLFLAVRTTLSFAQSTCSPQGNVVVFSNYDGGILNININENIPNLKVGIATYEPTQVNIFGPFAANVVEVVYAGNNPLVGTGNLHCTAGVTVGSVNPLPNPNATVSILNFPPVTLAATLEDTIFPGVTDLVGYNGGIIGCTSCSLTQSTGGVNNADQIIDYFSTTFGEPVRFLKTQYGCWCDTLDMSLPPSCCFELDDPVNGLILTASDSVVCAGQPVTLSVLGGSFSTYLWSTGQTTASIEVTTAGVYAVTATNECGVLSANYNLASPAELLLTVTVQDATCLGNGLGAITFEASGGTAPYAYSTDGLFFVQESVFNLPPGIYQTVVEDASGCVTSIGDVVVGEGTPLQIGLTGPTDSVPVGEPFNLSVTADKPLSELTLQWPPEVLVDCTTCPEVVAAITQTTTFVVQATDAEGCTATAQLTVLADNSKFVYSPNVFAPETFGLNAVFNLFTGQGVERLEVLRIYDRWGGLVFEGIDGWNGSVGNEKALPGVYAWYAELVYADGTNGKLEGHVTLIR